MLSFYQVRKKIGGVNRKATVPVLNAYILSILAPPPVRSLCINFDDKGLKTLS